MKQVDHVELELRHRLYIVRLVSPSPGISIVVHCFNEDQLIHARNESLLLANFLDVPRLQVGMEDPPPPALL